MRTYYVPILSGIIVGISLFIVLLLLVRIHDKVDKIYTLLDNSKIQWEP